jgi:TetR/AcrR family transcriptional regulator, ethionamide resistance regulator
VSSLARRRHHRPVAAGEHDESVRSRNATERAILDAARQALLEERYERLTMDGIAKRAFVSRTAVYFYFPNKRAVIDRLIQRAFNDIHIAASPYLEGDGEPRRELRVALSRVMAVVNRDAHILLLAAHLSGREDRLPPEWAPYIHQMAEGAEQRIARDQKRGIAPDDIAPRLSSQALLAMVEAHISREIVVRGGDINESIRVLAELWWRAVYSRPEDVAAASGG